MTSFEQFDMMARGGSLALLALWSWTLVRDHPKILAARLAVLMNLAIACYLIVTTAPPDDENLTQIILALGAGATPGLFWLFARAWFDDESRVSKIAIALVALSIANVFVLQLTFADKPPIFYASAIIFRVGMLAFGAAGLWIAWRGRNDDLIESRRKLRPLIVMVVGGYVLLVGVAEMVVFNDFGPRWFMQSVGSSIVFVTFACCAAMFGMRQTDLFGPSTAPAKAPSTKLAADDPLGAKLLAFMESEMPHRDETMSIAKLSAQLNEQEYRLRRTINGQMGHRNFAAFLNGFRLAEVKAALVDPTQKDVTIITIALDAGFGSLGPFNRAFREAEGMTPSEYRARATG
ncbi:helix-turn-helix domain-containing protein [Sphingorhabdus sp.]|jgi:AraC-like DNA-binding protein|uniref:helix-turn-helix domain-containing protein n=1 Tax=Sphingorhabdus sp. TaxID=1902408 RepID=UPI003BAFCE85|nr:AraC family transcriptional regulator [Sphingomonadales bacterium]MBK9430872.1 AraC family transcriptional regulator [Sphingomonadales bacterium]